MVRLDELNRAIGSAKQKHSYPIDKHLAFLVIQSLGKLKEDCDFKEARRYALNECCIWGPEARKAYNSVACSYFGAHGGRKGRPEKKKKDCTLLPSPITEIKEEEGGQLAFNV